MPKGLLISLSVSFFIWLVLFIVFPAMERRRLIRLRERSLHLYSNAQIPGANRSRIVAELVAVATQYSRFEHDTFVAIAQSPPSVMSNGLHLFIAQLKGFRSSKPILPTLC